MTKLASQKNPTIHDVAEKAKVAVGTVSRYLNGQSLRSGNSEKVAIAIADLAFRRSNAAAEMRRTKSKFVGFILPMFDEFHTDVLAHVIQDLREHGYIVLPYSHGNQKLHLPDALSYFSEHRVAALITSGDTGYEKHAAALRALKIPLILYSNELQGLDVDRVLVNDRAGARGATRHLIEMGHRRIAVLTGNMADSTAQSRFAGFCEALAQDGQPPPAPNRIAGGGWLQHHGYLGTKALLDLPEPPTAIFSSNYMLTLGAFQVLREMGLSVPENVSFVTFGDIAHYPFYGGGVTAVQFPIQSIANSITEHFISRHQGKDLPLSRTISHDCSLIVRGSVRRI